MTDPVRVRRQQVARWTRLANRVGYLCFGIAILTFVVGFIVSFNGAVSAIVVASMIVGSVLLAPAIVLGYAVKAAERDTSVSALVREYLSSLAEDESEFDRRKRLQDEVLASLGRFRAGDRLTREQAHNRRAVR